VVGRKIVNPFDILGSLMQGGMRPSGGRLERTLGNQGLGGPGGMYGSGPGAAGAGAMSILGTLAAQAVEYAKQMMSGAGAQDGPGAPQLNLDDATAVIAGMRKPMETDAIVRAVPNQQVAAQIYAASLMAIEVDTDAERRYIREIAGTLGMEQPIVA
jgi:hypothetical protein